MNSSRENVARDAAAEDAKGPTVIRGGAKRYGNIVSIAEDAFTGEDPNRKFVHDGIVMNVNHPYEGSSKARMATLESEIGDEPLTGIEGRIAYRFVKRTFDIVFSAFVLVAFSWLYAIIAIAIKIDDPKGPVIFKQERIGKDGKPFQMYKFRSMCVDAEDKLADLRELNEKTGPVFKMAEDPRITRVGKVIRKLSLDELPQFVNVLRGNLTVVGPRPALPSEVETYNDYQKQRLLVKQGITCYWQTRRNRDSITFDEWVDLDLLYVRKCGVWSDLKLIVQTVGVVLTAQGS
jgi:lipopolysaccharide/colanic/teichoic acid biosynthesis glycosyltransferase